MERKRVVLIKMIKKEKDKKTKKKRHLEFEGEKTLREWKKKVRSATKFNHAEEQKYFMQSFRILNMLNFE